MMTDIVERLRKQMMLSDLQSGLQPHYVCHEAADEIERLREALRKTLSFVSRYTAGRGTDDILDQGYAALGLEAREFEDKWDNE